MKQCRFNIIQIKQQDTLSGQCYGTRLEATLARTATGTLPGTGPIIQRQTISRRSTHGMRVLVPANPDDEAALDLLSSLARLPRAAVGGGLSSFFSSSSIELPTPAATHHTTRRLI
jgi:hypothetical protein